MYLAHLGNTGVHNILHSGKVLICIPCIEFYVSLLGGALIQIFCSRNCKNLVNLQLFFDNIKEKSLILVKILQYLHYVTEQKSTCYSLTLT